MTSETTPETAPDDDATTAPPPATGNDQRELPDDVVNRGERDIEEEETAAHD